MRFSEELRARTRIFARVLGPYFVIVCVLAVVRASDMRAVVSAFGANPLWPWVAGSFVLVGGLTITALHQYWRGAAAIIVSLTGWLLALRGLFLLAFPQTFISAANSVIGADALWRTVCICFAAIGLYLTYVGWMPAPSRPTSQAASATGDLPRAA
jgi:hypothetical protein